jgi:hypothetical protein
MPIRPLALPEMVKLKRSQKQLLPVALAGDGLHTRFWSGGRAVQSGEIPIHQERNISAGVALRRWRPGHNRNLETGL